MERSQVRDTIWNLFYDRIVDQVTSVTLLNSTVVTIQKYANAWNSSKIKNKSDLPILIIEPPKFSTEQIKFKTTRYTGLITIYINTTQKEAAIKFIDAINESIESYRTTLKNTSDIKFLEIDDEDDGNLDLNTFRGYYQLVRYKFEVDLTRW